MLYCGTEKEKGKSAKLRKAKLTNRLKYVRCGVELLQETLVNQNIQSRSVKADTGSAVGLLDI